MPTLTPEQKRRFVTHLRQESIRLRKSNPEVSELTGKMAIFFQKKAEAEEREKQKPAGLSESEMLTPSELENLRRIAKEHSAYGKKAFKNHTVDLGVKDDATLHGRPTETGSDTSPAGVDPAAQKQSGTLRADREGRNCAQEDR